MQIVDTFKCPNCGAVLNETPSHGYIVCPYCDSRLKVAGVDKEQEVDTQPDQEVFNSIEDLVKSCCLSLQPIADEDDCDLLFVDEDVSNQRVYPKAVKNLGIPKNETCYLVYDNTVMSSCKVGYAVTTGGIYYNYNGKTGRGHMDWPSFVSNKMTRYRKDDCSLYFSDGATFSMTCGDYTKPVYDMLSKMQEQMTEQFFSK